MGTGGTRAIRSAMRMVRDAQESHPDAVVGDVAGPFDSADDPTRDVVGLFNSLTPRDAAGVYLSVALGPPRDTEFVRDAQKALAVIKTLLVMFFFFFSSLCLY